MEKMLSFKFPHLSVEDKVVLRQVIRAQRAQFLSEALEKIQDADVTQELGGRAVPVTRFVGEMLSLSRQDPDLFWRVLDHWATQFLLSSIIPGFSKSNVPADADHFATNLSAILLLERLRSHTPVVEPATYTVRTDRQGRIHSLLHGVSLEFQNERFQSAELRFECAADGVSVSLPGKSEPELTLTLPVQDNPVVKLVPLAVSEAADFPVIDERTIFGKYTKRVMENPETPADAKAEKNVISLKDSLTGAQDVIKRLWPEALEWAQTLVPAFVDLGTPQANIRLSLSYEPGSPIFMSKVNNHLLHAEDMVHEIQHHRLHLFASPDHFKSWMDLSQVYISPYRTDPRHLRGLILGVHAFLTVNELRKRRLEDGERGSYPLMMAMAETHYENLYALRTIMEHEEFDGLGRELFKQMAHTIAEHHSVVKPFVTQERMNAIEETLREHMAGVQEQATEIRNADPRYRDWDETARLAANFS